MSIEAAPMPQQRSTTELASTRDGLTQLRRHWRSAQPRAALLLVHGIGEHSGRYEHVGSFLAQRGIDVLAADNRGFGQSGGRRAHVEHFGEFLDDVEDLLAERRRLSLPVVLLGHSLGGLIVTSYLVEGRPRPDLAVLSAPALGARVPRWQRVAAPILAKVAPTLFVRSTIDGDRLSRDPLVGQRYTEDPLVIAGATAGLGRELFAAMARTATALDRITVPTYVLHGRSDELVPSSATEAFEALPDVTRRVYDDLRHECFNEPEQDRVLSELVSWLDERLAALT